MGLLIRQGYRARKHRELKTELFGTAIKTFINVEDKDNFDKQRQINGICPNVIHSLDAACLMSYILKCKEAGITSIMSVHDCYATLAPDCDKSAKFLREAFVEIYRQPVLENWTEDVTCFLDKSGIELPELPKKGSLDIEEVLNSKYFFN
jgi:DNA-directed RNA polymerase